MPETISNTQSQQLTTSDDGLNIKPVLQPESHFVIQNNNLTITQQNSFGPLSPTQFRTTSKITFTGNKKIYALCKGQVLLQPNTENTSKVNLILKPFNQPIKDISIKFIIYRGLEKSDFINNNLIFGDENTGTDFIKHIWKEFNQFYSSENTNELAPPFAANYIGFPTTTNPQTDTSKLIDSFFYKLSETTLNPTTELPEEPSEKAFELPIIKRGAWIGNANSDVGIDIVLNNGEYYIENDTNPFQLDLAFARSSDYKLDTANGTTDFQKKLIRESCTQFIDLVAFYGLHANGAGKLFVDENTTPLTSKEDIYNMLLGFYNKNTQYIYLQSNRQRSYNFYGNYEHSVGNTNNIKIGTDSNTLTETIFGNNQWPIHKVENNSSLYIQLTTDNNNEVALYTKLGNLISSHENNFVRNNNILEDSSNSTTVDINYTKPVGFSFNTFLTNTVCSLIQLIYEGKKLIVSEYLEPPTDPNADPIIPNTFYLKDIDDIFGLLDAVPFVATKNENELPSIMEHNLQIINFPNTVHNSDIGVVKTNRIEDIIYNVEGFPTNRVTYETTLENGKQNINLLLKTTTNVIDNRSARTIQFDNSQKNYYEPLLPYYISNEIFDDNGTPIMGLTLELEDEKIPSKIIVGITSSENQKLKDIISTFNLTNIKLFFNPFKDDLEDLTTLKKDSKYNIHTLGIIGENNNGVLNLYYPNDDILIYTIDNFILFSYMYSKYVIETKKIDKIYSNNTKSLWQNIQQ